MGAITSKTALAKSLGVSRSSLYYRPRRPAKDEVVREKILKTLDAHPAYGHRRIAWHLQINKKAVLRVMNLYHIKPTIIRKNRYLRAKATELIVTTTPDHLKTICPIMPNAVWVGDFTELWFHNRILFLATVLDAYTREVIGWQIGLHHTASLVIDVLKEAKRKRHATAQFFHSDQGSEYTSHACVNWLVKNSITPSNSPKGKPWRNGKQESFYGRFKLEFGTPGRFETLEQLIEAIGKYVHYYNTERIHSALRTPPRTFFETKKQPLTKRQGV